jgi:DNA repair protein RadC
MFNFDFSVAEIDVSYSHRIPAKDRIRIESSMDVYKACTQFWPSFDHVEYFYVLYLNRSNHLLGVHQLSKGGFTGTVIDVRVVFQVALKACACSIILAHNHPSGNLTPSDADQQITRKIKDAGKILEIQVLDHLIVTSESFYSFADNGML